MIILTQNSTKVAFRQPHNLEIAQEQAPERAMAAGDAGEAGDAEYVQDAEYAGDAEYAAGAAYEEFEDVTEGLLVSGLSGEYAAGVAYERLEEDADYWADADVSDGEMADARLNPTVEKLAKALTNHYPGIRACKFWANLSRRR
jgi:hypothetical protein